MYDDFCHLEELDCDYSRRFELPKRSVFVFDDAGVVSYRWVSDDSTKLPDNDGVKRGVTDAAN